MTDRLSIRDDKCYFFVLEEKNVINSVDNKNQKLRSNYLFLESLI